VRNFVELHPDERIAHIFRVRRKVFHETDFENYV
jgi:hypothetical protein